MIEPRIAELLHEGLDRAWFDNCDHDSLMAYLANLKAHRCQLDAVEANIISQLNDRELRGGGRRPDPRDRIRRATGASSKEAARKARRAALFDRWPRITEALADGMITSDHADLLTSVPERFHPQLEASLTQLLAWASEQSVDEFRVTVAEWKEQTALDAGEDIHKQRRDRRSCSIRQDSDGMTRVSAVLDPESGAIVRNAVTARAQQLLRDDQDNGESSARNYSQRCADALTELCGGERGSEGPSLRGTPSGVLVTIPLADLQAGLDGHVLGGASVPAETIRRVACTHGIIPAVLDSTGAVLDLGRKTRLATPAQRLALATRYGNSCAVPDCDSPFEWCHIHHLAHWEHGGSTDLDNLIPVCTRHHTQIHEGQLEITRENGEDQWRHKPARAGPLVESLRRGMREYTKARQSAA